MAIDILLGCCHRLLVGCTIQNMGKMDVPVGIDEESSVGWSSRGRSHGSPGDDLGPPSGSS